MEQIQLNEADDNRALTVAPGQQLVLRLPENPTTGYRWEPPAGVGVVADEYRPSEGTAMGGGGERVFTLATLATTGDLRFKLTRSWGGGAPERTFTLRLMQSG
ncbi:MAG: protease inhibitor I42 family protein [Candidatus Accumulibacter sp.]|jgi:inhibitor of cysteine peptidase|uniref:Protease inhibitor I42 family protein n=1 Tax=Candidatus Accumulibacter affinis TaxID=2954384 RepID=A0A935W552_9PROT|nr:protease inhibitor I42 family protein [Candidatus Accumulibacter affinis]